MSAVFHLSNHLWPDLAIRHWLDPWNVVVLQFCDGFKKDCLGDPNQFFAQRVRVPLSPKMLVHTNGLLYILL